MKEWDYIEDAPFIPVKIIGKGKEIAKLAIVDTGAKYCVIHDAIARDLELEKIDIARMIGFGSKKKFDIDLCLGSIEVGGRVEIVQFASVKDENYPDEAPKVILGRNLLNKFKITLDGKKRKIFLE